MSVAFEGPWHVHYGQLYVESATGGQQEDMADHFVEQANGLLGAAVPGALFLMTGLHTGPVGLRVEVLESEPEDDDFWDDVVEASFTADLPVTVVGWGGETYQPLDLAGGSYRVRWSANEMDAGRDQDTVLDDEEIIDRYLLQLWPADPAPDEVVRQASECAAYWHAWAREQR
ncbi:MAG TPA: hypothetical protein VGK78_14635 [Nocardioides sp.]|uniref:hypothetical protein n=1 Tax=Nocardioides sp. TaxID=35761 RepID=UPI002F41C747